ncbi:serine/threonine-protein kinase [Sorangium sp. So ce542]|uniref:serine/threonine-protein kinase n=1 Tax=Sorangium sp. So ce542 TaxID=3133316 RepID=UPI003F60AF69
MVAAPVAIGDVLAGKYRVEQIVGAGAMGTIVAAWHLELDQRVAMKFLHSPGTEGGDPAERFRREARALARIKSEHVARVLDVGSMQGGMPYMVMEFLEGNNLAEEIRARGPLPVVEAVGYVLEAIEAMAEAHAAGIVHRDLKPANLFLARRPDGGRIIKVLDFGISKSMLGGSRDELALTKTAALLGSPLYMSPEQVRCAKDVDARTDIWALGVIVYEMLIGRTPYNGDSVPQLFASLLHETPPTMAQLRADVPRELDAVVMHCLAKDPEQRWRNVGDLAAALLAFGPAGTHVHVERARRVLGLPGARSSAFSQPGISLPPPGAATGGQVAGARLSVPHGAPSPAASADTGPAVSSWSNTGQVPRAGRKGAFLGVALAVGAALAAFSFGALLFLFVRPGSTAGGDQPPAPAATQLPGAAAQDPAPEAAPGAASAAPPGATPAPEPPAPAGSAAAPEPPAPAGSAAAPEPPAAAGSAAAPAAASSPPPASRPVAPPASAAARPAERPQPGAGAQQEPRRNTTISDFGGRR